MGLGWGVYVQVSRTGAGVTGANACARAPRRRRGFIVKACVRWYGWFESLLAVVQPASKHPGAAWLWILVGS